MHCEYMREALKEAEKAAKKGEVPVGCVIVYNDKIIAKGHNLRESRKNPLYHAEIIAINKAAKKLKSWRLSNAKIYVTLEPCPMCTGAIINARIPEVYFGAFDKKSGCLGSLFDLSHDFNHHPLVQGGILNEECAQVLKDFFKERRG